MLGNAWIRTLGGLAILMLLLRIRHSVEVTWYVQRSWHQFSPEAFKNSPKLPQLLAGLKRMREPPAIFILNQFALPMTDNWLCNTEQMEGVHERVAFVALDNHTHHYLTQRWPRVFVWLWETESLKNRFNFAQGAYQSIYTLRSNLASVLAEHGQAFWMMQQDTFWRENLFDLGLEHQMDYDILFDQIGSSDDSLRAQWVNGANFFVRPSNATKLFFENIGYNLQYVFAPDMGLMILQCLWTFKDYVNCQYMPHKITNCWEWLDTDRSNPPHIMQLDCETEAGGKIPFMKQMGFYFVNADGTCNSTVVDSARRNVREGTVPWESKSFAKLSFWIYWLIADFLLFLPGIGPLLKPILPSLGFYLMLTLPI